MKSRNLYLFIAITFTCLVFAGCKPKPKEEVMNNQQLTVVNTPPPVVSVETGTVQQEACGKLPTTAASRILGVQVAAPSVTQVVNSQGAARNICTYAQKSDLAVTVLTMTATYTRDNDPQRFQQLWDAQKNGATKIDGINGEVYTKNFDGQPLVYVLTSDAQYWLVMGKGNQTEAQQLETLKKVATELLK
jgi:hypothetical protein